MKKFKIIGTLIERTPVEYEVLANSPGEAITKIEKFNDERSLTKSMFTDVYCTALGKTSSEKTVNSCKEIT